MNPYEFRTLRQRYKAHIERPEHSSILRPGQLNLARDGILPWMYERNKQGDFNSRGYFVRPTGTGKTVSLIDFIIGINSNKDTGEQKWDKRVLVLTPTNLLNRQFAAEMGVHEFRDPNKDYAFNIPEEKIGVYDATESGDKRRDSLDKHIVVMTYDSFRNAVKEDHLSVSDFSSVLLDEVHTRPRGDVNGEFIRTHLFNEDEQNKPLGEPPTLVIGATATHLYKSGFTIGDYLFGGDEPIYLTRINDAVQDREIPGYRNVIVETTYDPNARFEGDDKLSANARQSRLKQAARDTAAVRILKYGHDPRTKKSYRDMKSVWYCENIKHAKRLAKQINDELGADPETPYAQAVSGEMNKNDLAEVIVNYKRGGEDDPKALTNADILINGFDDERAELCFITWPTGSPTEKQQMGGRVLRYHKLKPHATIFDFPDPDKDSPPFGELAGGYVSFPKNLEYGPTAGRGEGEGDGTEPEEKPWPKEILDIEGLNAHYLTHDIEKFALKRRAAQASDKKPAHMLTPDEMARKIGINADILEKYVFTPLQGLYDQRSSRLSEIDIRNATEDNVFINGQRFAVGSKNYPGMAHYRTGPNETTFCMSQEAADACRFALFGKLPSAKPYFYNKASARRVLGVSENKMDIMALQIQEAYHHRQNYQRNLHVGDVDFELNYDVTFCIDRNKPQIYFSSEGLQKLHRLAYASNKEESVKWWGAHPDKLSMVKSPSWFNKAETMGELNIQATQPIATRFNTEWKGLESTHKKSKQPITSAPEGGAYAYKRIETAPLGRSEFCIDKDALERLGEELGIKTAGDKDGVAGAATGKRR